MSNTKKITFVIMLNLFLSLYANGTVEKEQRSVKLIIKDSSYVIDEFSIIRDANIGQELFYIISSIEDRKYYLELVPSSDIIGGNPLTFEISGDDIGVEIEGINSYVSSLSTSDLDLRRLKPIHNYYKPEITQIGVRLISYDNPANSYQFILRVHPTISIPDDETVSDSVLQESLRDNSLYRRFFRKQVLGDSSFTSTEFNPFPISNLNNHYDYIIENNSTADETVVERIQFETFIRPFDVIYNHDVNDNEELGDSIIYKFLKVYFNNDKPLFHSYINQYMDNNFNYHQYDKITAAEGKELVNHALKYLTWGLECTPEENYKAITDGEHIYPSQLLNYEANETDDFNDLTTWIRTSSFEADNRDNNYLGYEPSDITEVINASDITYDQDKISELQDLAGDYFTPTKKVTSELELTTPFKVGDTVITGSALPYVKGGIDTPRTFNYKMTKQFDIVNDFLVGDNRPKSWYGSYLNSSWSRNDHYFTTKSNGNHMTPEQYYFYYFDNSNREDYVDITTQSPFMPGRETEGKYRGLNLTGVDSLGLLSGALSMTSYYKRILNIYNSAPTINMDSLNRMVSLPAFSSNPEESQDLYRLTRSDIERSSVIIPDLSYMQPGDLLVKGTGDDTDLAIVIDTGYTESDETFYLGNVLVLSVNEEDKRVAVCYWGQNATYSSFTKEPKNYVLRRLLKFTGDISDSNEYSFSEFTELEKTADYWDPFVFQPEPLFVHMDTSSSRNNSRWIPNTGEIYEISSIRFSPSELKPIVELEDYNNADVIIKAPSDINYDVTETGHDYTTSGNNILVNKGDGFAFYAINSYTDKNTNEKYYDAIRLATFNINTSSTNEFDRYTVEYNDDIFTSDGHCRDDYTLKYKKYEGLEFNIGTENKFTNFGIRPLKTNIRPGDDILLNFEIYDNGNSIPVNSPESEFLAVYDEKMLWRANLYIDEGEGDWNSENPWNAPSTAADTNSYGAVEDNGVIKRFMENTGSNSEMVMLKYYDSIDWQISTTERVWYGANEWNVKYDGTSRLSSSKNEPDESEYLSALNRVADNDGDGKQVVDISSFTYHPRVDGASSNIVTNVVSYAYGCNDSPFEFNDEMRQQQSFYISHFNEGGIRFKKPKNQWPESGIKSEQEYIEYVADYPNDNTYPENTISLNGYSDDHTTSLRNRWGNYIQPFDILNINENSSESAIELALTTYDTTESFPFLPGYSLYYYKEFNSAPDWTNAVSSGVDCIGFVSRSASYSDNSYSWNDIDPQTIHDADKHYINVNYPTYGGSGDSYHISHRVQLGTSENLDKIKPGDLMYYMDGTNKHIVIILDINDLNNDNNITLNEIFLIESTWGVEWNVQSARNEIIWAKVINMNVLNDYNGNNWKIVRLKD